MDDVTIILVNGFHIGDLFSLPQIVRIFCESNPSISVELAIYNSFYLYKEIEHDTPNLHVVDINTHPMRDCIVDAIPGNVLYKRPSEKIYILNFAGFQHLPSVKDRYLECHYYNLYKTMILALEHVNAIWGTSFAMNECTDHTYLIPRIPDTDCTLFDAWRKQNPSKLCILYYNFEPLSSQHIGILPSSHECILYGLCNRFPDAAILVPIFSNSMIQNTSRPKNLISCEEYFGCVVAPDCMNLCKLAKMELQCDFSIHFDIGACFYYAGSMLYNESRCTILHASVDHFYYYRLKENFGNSISEEDYIKKVRALPATIDTSTFTDRIAHQIQDQTNMR